MSETLDVQYTQEIGYRAETTDGESLITYDDPLSYQFGLYTTSWGMFPKYRYEVISPYRGASFDPYDIRLAKSLVDGAVSFIPGNAQAIYHAIANSTSISEAIDTSGNTVTFADTDPDTIERANGHWTDTFKVRDSILIVGSGSNDGIYSIASISASVITLKSTDELSAEAMSSGTLTILSSGVAATEDHGGGDFSYAFNPVQNVKPQSFTYKYFTKNDVAAVHRKQVLGCRITQLSYNLDMSLHDAILNSNMNYVGINMENNLDTNDVVPVYATPYTDETDIELQEMYKFDNNMEFVWDNGDADVDLVPYMLDFNFIVNIIHRHRFVRGLLHPKWIGVGNRVYASAFRITRADETSVFDDFIGQVGNNFKDLRFKIFKNSTDYLEFTMNKNVVLKCDMNNTHEGEKQEPFYDVEAVVKSVVFKSRESTPVALYGL